MPSLRKAARTSKNLSRLKAAAGITTGKATKKKRIKAPRFKKKGSAIRAEMKNIA